MEEHMVTWSPQQAAALDAVRNWMRDRSAPFFYLAGFAGTGKTTLAKHFAEGRANVLYGASTGKAASVMRDRGCAGATTIHRLIYRPTQKPTERLDQLRRLLASEDDPKERERLRGQISDEAAEVRSPAFRLNLDSPVRGASLVIIDECSMVNERTGQDLLGFGVPVLVLGDPAQLPPVKSAGFFTSGTPDAMLTEVHRHARESGILRAATDIRNGKPLADDYGDDVRLFAHGEMDPRDAIEQDQILVGRRVSRRDTNRRVRELLGRGDWLPEPGDRLVCRRNNHDLGLLNGDVWTALRAEDHHHTVALTIEQGDLVEHVDAWAIRFQDETADCDYDKDVQDFEFGYALTAHLAQGSQWPSVVVFDESRYFRKDASKWLYTSVTRASERLTIIR